MSFFYAQRVEQQIRSGSFEHDVEDINAALKLTEAEGREDVMT